MNVYSCHEGEVVNEHTEFIIPTITTDGRITFLSAGKAADLLKIHQQVSEGFTPMIGQLSSRGISDISIGNFAVAGTAFHLPDVPEIMCIVIRTLVFPKPVPELEQIYSLLKTYCEVSGTAEEQSTRTKIQSYFTGELQKKWINDVISGWKKELKWGKIIDTEIKEIKKRKAKH